MRTALEEARTGASEGGLPIGAALVDAHGRLVVTGSNWERPSPSPVQERVPQTKTAGTR